MRAAVEKQLEQIALGKVSVLALATMLFVQGVGPPLNLRLINPSVAYVPM